MAKNLRAITTVEVIVMTLAITIVMLSTFGAQAASFRVYQELIHRERAALYAVETLEQLEAMKLTRLQQNYRSSWKNFLGNFDQGSYQFVGSDTLGDLFLSKSFDSLDYENHVPSVVRIYEPEMGNDFYSRLERRITIAPISGTPEKRLVTVSVYFGIPGGYSEKSTRQVSLQTVFADQVGPGFAL